MFTPSILPGASPHLKIVTQAFPLQGGAFSRLPLGRFASLIYAGRDCLRHWRAVISLVQDLFGDDQDVEVEPTDSAPLATRMRPRSLDELVGQEHILGPGKLLRRRLKPIVCRR